VRCLGILQGRVQRDGGEVRGTWERYPKKGPGHGLLIQYLGRV
jgi:hypothetical protein